MSGSREGLEFKIRELMEDFDMAEYYYRGHEESPGVLVKYLESRLENPLNTETIEAKITERKERLRSYARKIATYLEDPKPVPRAADAGRNEFP
jgi:hypothetical protein